MGRPTPFVIMVIAASTACGGGIAATPDAASGPEVDAPAGQLTLPSVNGAVDYQLGGAYPPPAGVTIVSRDRTAERADGVYTICYVNGFQIQPDEESLGL